MGVLQHCPDVKKSFLSLVPFLKPSGEIVIDVYETHTGIPPLKYWARPFVKHMKTETIYKLVALDDSLGLRSEKSNPPHPRRRPDAGQSDTDRPDLARPAAELHGRRAERGKNPERTRHALAQIRPAAEDRRRARLVTKPDSSKAGELHRRALKLLVCPAAAIRCASRKSPTKNLAKSSKASSIARGARRIFPLSQHSAIRSLPELRGKFRIPVESLRSHPTR